MTERTEKRKRFYRNPNTGEAPATHVLSVRLDETPRFVLYQAPESGEYISIVSDAAGRIPVFDSQQSAREYIARYFPLDGKGDHRKDADVKRWQEERATRPPSHVDFEIALRWANNPAQRATGPSDVIHAWEMLFCADAAPPSPFFDPMGFMALVERIAEGRDRAENEFLLTGMKLRAIVGLFQRQHGPAARAPWPDDPEIWNEADDARLAPVIRDGIADFASRLSTEAATVDVAATWPQPDGARLRAVFSVEYATEFDATREKQKLVSDSEVEARVASDVGPLASAENYPGLSSGALARFAQDQQEYATEMREFHRLNSFLNDQEHRTIWPGVWITNDGDRRAENVVIRMHVPAGIIVVPSGSEPYRPNRPAPLPAAAEYENPATKREHVMPRPRPSKREEGRTGSYNVRETIETAPDGGTIVGGLGMNTVGAHDGGSIQPVTLRFPDWASVRPFHIDVEMQGEGGASWTSRLLIRGSIADWSQE